MSKTVTIAPTLGDPVWSSNQIISADEADDRFVVDGVRHDVIIAGLNLGFPEGATILTHLGVKVLLVDCTLDYSTTKIPVSSIPLGDPEE